MCVGRHTHLYLVEQALDVRRERRRLHADAELLPRLAAHVAAPDDVRPTGPNLPAGQIVPLHNSSPAVAVKRPGAQSPHVASTDVDRPTGPDWPAGQIVPPLHDVCPC